MPLNSGCSITALRRNISELIGKGYPKDQAVAVAIDSLKRSCKAAKKPLPEIGELVSPGQDDEVEQLIQVLLSSCAEGEDASYRPTQIWGTFNYGGDGSKESK